MKVNSKLAVDTNAVIAYREGVYKVCEVIEEADTLFLPAVVLSELLYGAANSVRSQENEQAVRIFVAQSVVIPIDEDIATQYAAVRLRLKKIGRPIPENDIWLATTCMEFNLTLLSRDIHFDYIHDLKVINWVSN